MTDDGYLSDTNTIPISGTSTSYNKDYLVAISGYLPLSLYKGTPHLNRIELAPTLHSRDPHNSHIHPIIALSLCLY